MVCNVHLPTGTMTGNISFKVGLPSFKKKNCFVCFNGSPLKLMKNAFYFILKDIFVLKIFKVLSWLFGHVKKGLIRNTKSMTSQPG